MPRKPISRRERPAKPALSRQAVVKVALGILKKEGLEKVTMRRIAAALDTGPASLYVYVKATQDLHAQLLDALLVDLPAPSPGRRWRTDLLRVAEAFFAVLMRYPEIARMTMSTKATGPNTLRLLDTVIGLLMAGGADARTAAWGVDLFLTYVIATAVEHAGRPPSDSPELHDLREKLATLDPTTHPHLAKLGPELLAGQASERFRWGLQALVRGVMAAARPER
jgi:AcrR family transcriptional regulator